MKVFLILSLALVAVLARPEGDDEEFYSFNFDKLDIDGLVENERLLKAYAQCFTDKGNCTPEGKSIKKILPDAVETNCKKCSPTQRVTIRKMIIAFKEKLPEEWEAMITTYDPERKHKDDLTKFLEETD